jgi:hypothetical protein
VSYIANRNKDISICNISQAESNSGCGFSGTEPELLICQQLGNNHLYVEVLANAALRDGFIHRFTEASHPN